MAIIQGRTARAGAIAITLATAAAGSAQAADFVIGAGRLDYRNDDAAYLALELHSETMWSLGGLDVGLGLGAVFSDASSSWLGGGVTALYPIGYRWFVEGSFMPGLYDAGGYATDLGNDLEFRTQIGIGYRLNERSAVSLAASHMSNADTADENPGVNGVSLRLRTNF
ncbi:acyloxyacyl hydrolase [Frigidibacter sp. MR17.24]|uniref:acyloxyacyl hydrolase n=1 Tax=Frigidibacter sp. MR17.24 TaxID=3127345 RepID=UPI003012FBE0